MHPNIDVDNALVCSAWMNFMPSLADFAERCLYVVSRDGCSRTSRGGDLELRRATFHERIPLLRENRSLRVKRVVERDFEDFELFTY